MPEWAWSFWEAAFVPGLLAALAVGASLLLIWLGWVKVVSRSLLRFDRWLADHEARLRRLERSPWRGEGGDD